MWCVLLEKAYAKLYGCYQSIEGGLVYHALCDMTNGIGMAVNMTQGEGKQSVQNGSLFKQLFEWKKQNYLMGAGSSPGSDTDISLLGIVFGHAYSILDVQEVDGYQLLKLRNPCMYMCILASTVQQCFYISYLLSLMFFL
jgi:hypothetical protein